VCHGEKLRFRSKVADKNPKRLPSLYTVDWPSAHLVVMNEDSDSVVLDSPDLLTS
jgi:hypothetical protein